MIKILFIGDVFGAPGRGVLERLLMGLRDRWAVDMVVANGENAAGGLGITPPLARELWGCGVDVITTGNHAWKQREIFPMLDEEPNILRPANYPGPAPGRGHVIYTLESGVRVGVMNLQGRVFMEPLDNPFHAADEILAGPLAQADVVVLDMHAEASSEKQAMGRHLDGRAAVVAGTHTHVQTADEKILPGGTAYISDLGLTGPHASVIGMEPRAALNKFITGMPMRFKAAKKDPRLQGALVEIDEKTGRALGIVRVEEV
jgi:metallophosphoesterase (TIGR00282 family)